MMLAVEGLNAYYGKSHILHDVSLRVERDQSVAVIGRNGMGKSTLLHSVMRMGPRIEGTIVFDGHEITSLPLYEIARLGLGIVPEGRRVFKSLTVRENLDIARRPGGEPVETVFELFPRLRERHRQLAGSLSGGEQQMLSIGRALVNGPKLLLVDEPTEGLAPLLVLDLIRVLKTLRQQGLAFVVVEQKFAMIQELVDYVYVLEKGQVVASDTPANLLAQPELLSRHLGTG
jgi:branched-chain amino acid transport system ATP-binding protein